MFTSSVKWDVPTYNKIELNDDIIHTFVYNFLRDLFLNFDYFFLNLRTFFSFD